MFRWLVVFDNAEFVVLAQNILDAKKEVLRKIPEYGLRKGQHFELYRLREAVAYGKI